MFKGFIMFIISHTGAVCRAKLQTASKTDVSLAEKYVSNLEFLLLTGKKIAAEALFGVSAAVASRYDGELVL